MWLSTTRSSPKEVVAPQLGQQHFPGKHPPWAGHRGSGSSSNSTRGQLLQQPARPAAPPPRPGPASAPGNDQAKRPGAPPPARRSTAASFRSRMGMENGLVQCSRLSPGRKPRSCSASPSERGQHDDWAAAIPAGSARTRRTHRSWAASHRAAPDRTALHGSGSSASTPSDASTVS